MTRQLQALAVLLAFALPIAALAQAEPQPSAPSWPAPLVAAFSGGPTEAVARSLEQFPAEQPRLAAVADWIRQDGLSGGWRTEVIQSVLEELGESAGPFQDRYAALKNSPPADDRPWVELYLDACLARRAARLQPHAEQLKHIVFTKHYDLGGSHYAYTEGQSDAQKERHFQPGSSLCVFDADGLFGNVRTLVDEPGGVIRDPDLSYDAQRILFARKKSLDEDDYHLYELALADQSVRQLTSGRGFADYEGVYLPNGHILFNSTRCVQTVDCWWTEVSNLFTCDGQGRYLRQLGFDQVHTNYPQVAHDGRVIYTRWDYNDRGQIYPQGLFQMNQDGTSQAELYGNNSWFPTTILHARTIPGTGQIVCIFSGHHTYQSGWLGILDPSRGRQENQGAQLIAPVRPTPAERIDRYGQTGDQFQYPYPLSPTAFLVGLRPQGAERFGVYLVESDGRRELLASDPKISCSQPIPLAPRPMPAERPNLVDYRADHATVYLHDIFHGPGLDGVDRSTVRSLRVVALEFRAAGVGENRNRGEAGSALASTPVSIEGAWDVKRVLGTAQVYSDGSACFTMPARTPVYFQALDERGRMVQSMRSWVSLQPGERVSCVGCHEHKNTAPPVAKFTEAMAAGPQSLEPLDDPPRGFSFIRDVQPIVDRHCVRCHCLDQRPSYVEPERISRFPADAPKEAGASKGDLPPGVVPAFSLKGTQFLDPASERNWSDAYVALAHRHVANWINVQSAPPMLPPYHAGSARSPLIEMLESGSHHGVSLSPAELERFQVWIDLLVPYCGDYTEAMNEGRIPVYQHFLHKRQQWQAQEAENIAEYLKAGGRRGE